MPAQMSRMVCFFSLVLFACGERSEKKGVVAAHVESGYLNHSDSARYVGMNTCRSCHQDIYNSFIKTGMGSSFDLATRKKSAADFSSAHIYDKFSDLHYKAEWINDSLFFGEYRLEGRDTVHIRKEQVNYIIGSGQHTNSHLQVENGYINQMPMTWYSQKKHWDLPPGFENGVNTRFSRKIGLECMTCHNAYPEFEMGSENKFRSVPRGIDCERCHGPGSVHVAQRQTGSRVDTSRYIDYSIVNPSKLSIDLQFDICQRCHLQGNAVLKDGKSFYDFKPGQKLSDVISVFLPKYKDADDEFIMASHADRLKQSPCFIKSYEKVRNKNSLKPYKDAMTCITCHNPHVSVRETNVNVFNDACLKCHASDGNRAILQSWHKTVKQDWTNCVSCHMPVSGSTDIPHVTVHDHYIRKPVSKTEEKKIRTFVGLFSVNEKNPDILTRAKAFIDQYDKFEQDNGYLDSAALLLSDKTKKFEFRHALLHLFFIRNEFSQITRLVTELGEKDCFEKHFTKKTYDNADAWSAYRIAEGFLNTGDNVNAVRWFKRSVELAPFNLDFRNKLGNALASAGDLAGAVTHFEYMLSENPKYVQAYSNLGYIKLAQGFPAEALRLYLIGKKLDPDNEALLLNLAGYYLSANDIETARFYLKHIVRRNPGNQRAKMILEQIGKV